MASEIKVNTIKDLGGNTIVSSNGSGTFTSNLPSTTLTGSTNNQVTTVTGANAITGETNLIYDQTRLGVGANGASADLGNGIHIKLSDAGSVSGGLNIDADDLVIESSGSCGMTILTGTSNTGAINFADSGNANAGVFRYDHPNNSMDFFTNGSERMSIDSSGDISVGTTSNSGRLHVEDTNASQDLILFNATSTSFTQNVMKVQCSRNTSNATFGIMHARNGGGHVFNIDDGGNVKNASNSYGALSDERIKQDIADASSQWNDIKALKIKKYKLKKLVNRDGADNTPYYLGVVAQELEASGMNGLVDELQPEKEDVPLSSDFGTVVSGTAENGAKPIIDENDNITGYEDLFTAGQNKKQVKYSILYMKSIKALQEAMTKIETLETENTDIKARLTALENA